MCPIYLRMLKRNSHLGEEIDVLLKGIGRVLCNMSVTTPTFAHFGQHIISYFYTSCGAIGDDKVGAVITLGLQVDISVMVCNKTAYLHSL